MVQYGLPTLDVDELEEEIDQLHEVVKEQAAKNFQLQEANTVLWEENHDMKKMNGRLTRVSLPRIVLHPVPSCLWLARRS